MFNVHKFIVTLNDNFDGPDLKRSYIFDLISKKELNKDINFEVSRDFLKKYDNREENIESKYFDSIELVLDKKGLSMIRRSINE